MQDYHPPAFRMFVVRRQKFERPRPVQSACRIAPLEARTFVLMSAEHWIGTAGRRVHRTFHTTTDTVERTEMDREHTTLDELRK
jgi:hypothetical protein